MRVSEVFAMGGNGGYGCGHDCGYGYYGGYYPDCGRWSYYYYEGYGYCGGCGYGYTRSHGLLRVLG